MQPGRVVKASSVEIQGLVVVFNGVPNPGKPLQRLPGSVTGIHGTILLPDRTVSGSWVIAE